MLKKKMLRDIMQNKSQFITIFLMVLIGIMVYVGVEAYMSGMVNARDKFNNENNIQDLNVIGQNFTKEDYDNIYQKLVDGSVEILKDTDAKDVSQLPLDNVKVNFIQLIKNIL